MNNRPLFYSWDNLLEFIVEGKVIPIVGPELMIAKFDGETEEEFIVYLARKLASMYHVPQDDKEKPDINKIVASIIAEGGRRDIIYPAIRKIIREPLPIPPAIEQLVTIDDFKLFVNLTYFPFLEQALENSRAEKVERLVYSPNHIEDIESDINHLSHPLVYYMMGYPSSSPIYAVTEEDTLEFIHSIQSIEKQPKRLFDQFQERHLLLLGCNYSNWLTPFFLRAIKKSRLSSNQASEGQLLADSKVQSDPNLCFFLERYCYGVEIYPSGNALEFVNELSRLWSDHKKKNSKIKKISSTSESRNETKPTGIFISYIHEDQKAVRNLRENLEKQSIDVWLDEGRLVPGDIWNSEIESNIAKCSLFMPVISANTEHAKEGYFRREWNLARERMFNISNSRKFIFPVVLDDTEFTQSDCPKEFKLSQVAYCPNGIPSNGFIDILICAYREAQKEMSRR